jgi:hypothetical protein
LCRDEELLGYCRARRALELRFTEISLDAAQVLARLSLDNLAYFVSQEFVSIDFDGVRIVLRAGPVFGIEEHGAC